MELNPDQADTIMNGYTTDRNELMPLILDLYHDLSGKDALENEVSGVLQRHSTVDNSFSLFTAGSDASHATKAMSYQYKSQPLPEFNGKDYSGYPDWKREWQLSVSVGKSAVWIITHLNKSTPS